MKTSLGRRGAHDQHGRTGQGAEYGERSAGQSAYSFTVRIRRRCVPQHNEVIRGLLRPDLFTVVHEQFFTDTTDYADIVLPATTFFEHKDLQKAYGHYYLQVSNQAIAPLGECRSNVELFRALAERMGFEDACFRESVDEMIDAALDSDDPWMEGMSRQKLEQGPVRMNFADQGLGVRGQSAAELRSDGQPMAAVPTRSDTQASAFLPFACGGFRTPSGKAELYSETLKAQGLDPVAAFTPPEESQTRKQRTRPAARALGPQDATIFSIALL